MEPYRHEGATSNPRIEIYDSHSPDPHTRPRGEADEYYNGSIPTTEANDALLSQSSYGAPGYEALSAAPYTHIDPENRLLPMEHDDPASTKRQPRNQISHFLYYHYWVGWTYAIPSFQERV
jgi:hypothetical protein